MSSFHVCTRIVLGIRLGVVWMMDDQWITDQSPADYRIDTIYMDVKLNRSPPPPHVPLYRVDTFIEAAANFVPSHWFNIVEASGRDSLTRALLLLVVV